MTFFAWACSLIATHVKDMVAASEGACNWQVWHPEAHPEKMNGLWGRTSFQAGQCMDLGSLRTLSSHQCKVSSGNLSARAASTLPQMERSLSKRMKEVYVEKQADDDLDKEYGDNVGGPPKNRRAGRIHSLKTPDL